MKAYVEGSITLPKRRTRFFKIIGFIKDLTDFYLKTKDFRQSCMRVLQSDTLLGVCSKPSQKLKLRIMLFSTLKLRFYNLKPISADNQNCKALVNNCS